MDTKTAHTPTPWMVSEGEKYPQTIFPANEHGGPRALCSIAWVSSWNNTANDAANAKFIIRSVNCHDELVNCLENLLKYIDDHDWRINSGRRHHKARAILVKSRGEII